MAATPQPTRIQASDDGSVIVTTMPDITEQEIFEDRESIVQRLHASHLNLQDHMQEFQEQWDENPALAFLDSAREGFNAGGADWLDDQAELFEKETWIDLGEKIAKATENIYDRLAIYSKQRYQELQAEVNKHIENPDDTLYNWSWWQARVSQEGERIAQEQFARYSELAQAVIAGTHTLLNTAEKAKKIYLHKEAIINLPALISNGDPKAIQAFVDNELMDIDPELANAIKNDPNFAVVLEIIADHDSALTYLSYASLMLEAIPPNFYAYAAGKGGAYLMVEVVMLTVTALLSAGGAAAARITMLVARFASTSVKAVTAGSRIEKAKAAISAFIRVLEDLSDAANRLHDLGAKLLNARSRGLSITGGTRTTLVAKKEGIKRDSKCRLCGSTAHPTPRSRQGTVQYQ